MFSYYSEEEIVQRNKLAKIEKDINGWMNEWMNLLTLYLAFWNKAGHIAHTHKFDKLSVMARRGNAERGRGRPQN